MLREAVRMFGVELEGYLDYDLRGEGWYISNEYFDIREDGSMNRRGSAYGLEIVSPPITNLDLITDVYERMHENGWDVDEDAGLHIHVDAGSLTPQDFYKVLLLMTAVEPILYSISDSFRHEDSDYCFPLTYFNAEDVLAKGIHQMYDTDDAVFHTNRYSALNYRAISKHGTIEFRYFSPQLQASEVIKRVELVTRLVDFAEHATYGQVYVVYDKIYNTRDFDIACDILEEVLELPFVLKEMKQNNLFKTMSRVEFEVEVEEFEDEFEDDFEDEEAV